jgi:hypothetical protein
MKIREKSLGQPIVGPCKYDTEPSVKCSMRLKIVYVHKILYYILHTSKLETCGGRRGYVAMERRNKIAILVARAH